MTPDGRDRAIVQFVARFRQLTSEQIGELVFGDRASRTPCYRALKRLVERRELARIERRIAGGSKGGSGQYVYQLGPAGNAEHRIGRYIPMRAVNFHSLAIADSYIQLLRLHHKSLITITGYLTEPDCWVAFGRHELKPDLFVEYAGTAGPHSKMWLEVDLASEGPRQIREKLERYWFAFNAADDEQWPVFPVVIWVAIDDERAAELKWILEQGPKNAQQLFRVCTIATLSTVFV